MPAALDVDWEAIKTLAIAVGIREAARRVGISEESVMQRSSREGWLRDLPRSIPMPPTVMRAVSVVSNPGEAMGQAMKDLNDGTRFGHAKVARKIADKLSQSDEDELLAIMPSVLMAGKHAALVAGNWGGQQGTTMRLDLLAGTLDVRSGSAPDPDFDAIEIPD